MVSSGTSTTIGSAMHIHLCGMGGRFANAKMNVRR